ncbi:MAG: 2-keto-4-pentenoate hydratase [Acidimicrobiales bacterium]|nr:2-keto-4-pentenoate hydratase [Acidimicrobiales bacterium]
MTIDADRRAQAAAALATAERDAAPIPPLSETYPGLEASDAYEIQLVNIRRRNAEGAEVLGHKVGLTATAMQELLGVDEPDYGHLLDDMVHANDVELPIVRFCAPRIEPEITFRLHSPLTGPGVTVEDVLAATDAVIASLEIVDSRVADWKITLADTIADNASAAGTVLGSTWVSLDEAGSLPDIVCELLVNGEVVSTGTGAAVLGHPAQAVAWLANTLGPMGITLEAGHLVMPGSCTSAPFLSAGDHVEARFSGLGTVTANFT